MGGWFEVVVLCVVVGLSAAMLLTQFARGSLLEKMPPLGRDKDWNVRR